jgi:hypothetical protein
VLLQVSKYNVASHATTIMFGYCRKLRYDVWWVVPAFTTKKGKVVVQ